MNISSNYRVMPDAECVICVGDGYKTLYKRIFIRRKNVPSVEEARQVLADDPESGFNTLDPEAVPDAGGMEDAGGAEPPAQEEGQKEEENPRPFDGGSDEDFDEETFALDAEFVENEHPRDENGRFKGGLEELKSHLKTAFRNTTEPMPSAEATKENFNRIAAKGKIDTPLGTVRFGEHQFEKIQAKGREYLFGTMADVLEKPALVIKDTDAEGRDALLFMKSYRDTSKPRLITSVVVEFDGEKVSVSTHEKKIKTAVNKIKNPEQIMYSQFGIA